MEEARPTFDHSHQRTEKTHQPRRSVLRALVGVAGAGVILAGTITVIQIITWPDVARLAQEPPPGRTAFMRRHARDQLRRGGDTAVVNTWISYDQISPNLKAAILVSEDIQFFDHGGFSVAEIKAALQEAWKERSAPRGASTLTQQLAKNLWLSPSRNPLRKLKEALLVRQLEKTLSKERIFELYLNVVEFGPGIYGAEAAAVHYFGKPASQLTRREGAELAAGLPRPSQWNPSHKSPAYEHRVGQIEDLISYHRTFLERRVGLPRTGPSLDSIPPLNLPLPEPSDTSRAPLTKGVRGSNTPPLGTSIAASTWSWVHL